MKLLYTHEHLTCLNYEKSKKPLIEKAKIEKDQFFEGHLQENKIILVLQGSINFSFGKFKNNSLSTGEMMIFSTTEQVQYTVKESGEILIIRLRNIKQLCDCFSLNLLMTEEDENFKYRPSPLEINERLDVYLNFLNDCLSDGLKCIYFLELKVKELFFILRAYYTKRELFILFHPLLSHDVTFSELVVSNHHKAKTVQDLADLLHYSLSGFQKRFKKAFGVSAYHWMKQERSKSIYHKINSSTKSLKEISDEYGFSSLSHFNDFCKSNFGVTPGKIRKKQFSTSQKKAKRHES